MRHYRIELTGNTALLMHYDNIEWADELAQWLLVPDNKKLSKAGDDRTPAWSWLGSLYHDNAQVALPGDNLRRCMMEAGVMVPVPGGKNGKTFKSQTQSGCVTGEPFWPLSVGGRAIAMTQLAELREEMNFAKHQACVRDLGFELYVKRATIGKSKHVRVRPRFDQWSVSGTLNVWDEQLTTEVLQQIWTFAGRYKGLGDWRPGGRTPGPHGMFEAKVVELN